MNGLLRPTRGEVRLRGADLRTLPLNRVAADVGYVFQNPDQQIFSATVGDEVAFGPRNFGYDAAEVAARTATALEVVGLTGLEREDPFLFGKGQRQRLAVASLLALRPRVLILDEPTTGLDPTARAGLWNVVDELTTAGTTVVLTTQYLAEADRLADQIVVFDHGRVAARGTPSELKQLVGGKVVTATIPASHVDRLPRTPDIERPAGGDHVAISFSAGNADAATELVADLAGVGVHVGDLEVTSPSLDDVFAHLTPTGARS
jgi:ABC-2 type transport system ATP-binding protein